MSCKRNDNEAMSLAVTEGLTVTILPDSNHEFLMTTKEVATGYGIHTSTLRRHSQNHDDELTEGKHYLSNVQILHGASKPGSSRTTMWTKRGIVRLGFFIKSRQARLFRDWAEELVISKLEAGRQTTLWPHEQKQLPRPRRHNRLTPERLVSIMADVAAIDNREVRMSITNKLMGGNE